MYRTLESIMVYAALRKIYKSIPKNEIKIRKRLFCAFSLPHLIWLFSTLFMFTEKQRQKIEHVYGTGLTGEGPQL